MNNEIIKKYRETYPKWENIQVTEVIQSSNEGSFAVVRAFENGIETEGEICYVSKLGDVKIFRTTEQLIKFIEIDHSRKWHQQIFSKAGISAIVTLVLLITLCILVFQPGKSDPQVLQILGGAFLAAIGFLFGTTSTGKTN